MTQREALEALLARIAAAEIEIAADEERLTAKKAKARRLHAEYRGRVHAEIEYILAMEGET
ncbi:hypothetical protein P7F88_25435 [Vibrio hannami]|uniref:hypothetical protein n=1 Tax=Vibrio hannami TaxID=2717094 RepID=UPI00240F694A|nr:hypothetical protein [Vibrio hannami]MDG3089209.1 hypothetical protein [Vibrio hannami]